MNNIAQPWKRLLAYVIDLVLSFLVTIFLIYMFSASSDPVSVLDHLSSYLIFLVFVYPVIYALFNSFLISTFGGTFGKLLTGTRIVGPDGKNLSFKRAFFRNSIAYMASGLLLGLGFLWVVIDKERRGWHDQIADTYVIVRNRWVAVLGMVSLVVFVFMECMLISISILNFKANQEVYTTIIDEVKTSLLLGNSTTVGKPTPTPFKLPLP